MASRPPFVADAVMDLKRKALGFKQAGDISNAKLFLQQARELEDPKTSQAFQRLAIVYKRNGDIEGAKDALKQSKQRKMEEEAEPEPMEEEEENETKIGSSSTSDATSPLYRDPVNQAIDEANLEELTEGVTYTIEEMLDVDTMVDMRASGMPIPTAAEYQQRAVACKKKALLAKESNDVAGAKNHLIQAKQLLAASERLYSNSIGTDDEGHEDYSLLDELMGEGENEIVDDDGFLKELFGAGSTTIELEDLEDMDADMLRDMIQAGMQVPDVADVMHQSKEKKAMALTFKNEGNMIAAKSALEESKRLERSAKQLSELLKNFEQEKTVQQELDPDAMLEAMMRAAEEETVGQTSKRNEEKETLKSSQEYKAEAVKLKKANRMDEALVALRLYKQALEIENVAVAAAKRSEYLAILQQEVDLAIDQIRCFRFYQRFIDKVCGTEQVEAWTLYLKTLKAVVEKNTVNDATPDAIVRASKPNAKQIIDGQDLGFVGSASTDPRIEVCILEVFDVSVNKNYRKYVASLKNKDDFALSPDSILVEGMVQLPPSADLPEDNLEFNINPVSYLDEIFQFDHSLFVHTERGASRFAKLLRRRLARRRVTIDVFLVPSIRKGFWPGQGKPDPILLGTAIVDLQHLLEKRSIAGDFPLLDITRRHELGGKVRLAVCTNQPFEEKHEPETAGTVGGEPSSTVVLRPYSFLTF